MAENDYPYHGVWLIPSLLWEILIIVIVAQQQTRESYIPKVKSTPSHWSLEFDNMKEQPL